MAVFISPDAAADYILAGKATFTVKSLASGDHYTFRMEKADDKNLWFVSILTLGDTYTYMGVVDGRPLHFRLTRKSNYSESCKTVKVFRWCLGNVVLLRRFPENLEVRHEGACGKCGRPLTRPDSIDRGIGPECAKRLGEAA